jgi:hypothetical protein
MRASPTPMQILTAAKATCNGGVPANVWQFRAPSRNGSLHPRDPRFNIQQFLVRIKSGE